MFERNLANIDHNNILARKTKLAAKNNHNQTATNTMTATTKPQRNHKLSPSSSEKTSPSSHHHDWCRLLLANVHKSKPIMTISLMSVIAIAMIIMSASIVQQVDGASLNPVGKQYKSQRDRGKLGLNF